MFTQNQNFTARHLWMDFGMLGYFLRQMGDVINIPSLVEPDDFQTSLGILLVLCHFSGPQLM